MPTVTTLVASDPDRIRDDLVDAVGRSNHRRRRRQRMIAGPIAIAVIAVIGLGFWTGTQAEPAFALRSTVDGVIEVEVYPDFDEVEALQDELRAAGVDTVVVALRGHPSLDGLVEVVSHTNENSDAFVQSFDGRSFELDPNKIVGEVEVLVYSAAADGESYQFAPSIFSEGQPLAGLPCAYPDEPLTTIELESRAIAAGLTQIRWVSFEGSGPGLTGTETDDRPEGIVTDAQLASADVLRVIVRADDGTTPSAAEMIGRGDGSHAKSPPCTPELAAAWTNS